MHEVGTCQIHLAVAPHSRKCGTRGAAKPSCRPFERSEARRECGQLGGRYIEARILWTNVTVKPIVMPGQRHEENVEVIVRHECKTFGEPGHEGLDPASRAGRQPGVDSDSEAAHSRWRASSASQTSSTSRSVICVKAVSYT